MAASVIGWTGCVAQAQEPALPQWERVFTIRAGPGYKDNVTLSALAPEASSFFKTGFDAFLSRLPGHGPQADLFFGFDDTRYFSSEDVEKEQIAFANGQAKWDWAGVWEASLGLEYFYLDQVLDVSISEVFLQAIQVRTHSLLGRPATRLNLSDRVWFAAGLPVARRLFDQPLDDYWEVGPTITLGCAYGHRSEVTLAYESKQVTADEAPQLAADGTPMPDTRRAFQQDEVVLAWRHHWDKERRWRTTAKLLFKRNEDNGGGFFDYRKYQAGMQLRYRGRGWEAAAEGRLSHYDYDVQIVSALAPEIRRRTEVLVTFRAERTLYKRLKLFTEYEHEQIMSNLSLEEYTVNLVHGGLSLEF
jgi:hypothetical protein